MLDLFLTIVLAISSTPWEVGPTYHCDIYPAANGFYERCYWIYPPSEPSPTPCVTDTCPVN